MTAFDAAMDSGQLHELSNDRLDIRDRYRELFTLWRKNALNRATLHGESTPEDELRLQQLGY